MVPPPPDLFSTTVDWPHAAWRCCARSLPIRSVVPPGAAGTITRTCSLGRQSAACTARVRAAAVRVVPTARTARRDKGAFVIERFQKCLFYAAIFVAGDRTRKPQDVAAGTERRLLAAEDLKDIGEVGQFLAAGRGGAADRVENPAVLQSVIRDPLDAAILVEIDRNYALVDRLFRQERGLLGARGDVVEDLA